MASGEEKRAKIIAEQAAREAAARTTSTPAPRPKPRTSWASSGGFGRRGFRNAKPPGSEPPK